jgi:hypothetical protein
MHYNFYDDISIQLPIQLSSLIFWWIYVMLIGSNLYPNLFIVILLSILTHLVIHLSCKQIVGGPQWEQNILRECHRYEKPTGKCHGLPWGTGTGSQNCTPEKPVPQPRVRQVWSEFKLRLKWHQRAVSLPPVTCFFHFHLSIGHHHQHNSRK